MRGPETRTKMVNIGGHLVQIPNHNIFTGLVFLLPIAIHCILRLFHSYALHMHSDALTSTEIHWDMQDKG